MKRKTFLLWMLALWAGVSTMSAVDAYKDGIYYNFSGTDAEVTYYNHNSSDYTGVKVIPSTVTYNGVTYNVTTIGQDAFYNCSGLTSITIPESVTSIGYNAFNGCSGLTSVHINDLAAWCNISFLKSGDNPLRYAHHLFINDTEVTDLVIPNSVTSIGNYAFYYCTGLTSVTIPESVTSIGEGAFSYSNSSLTSIIVDENNKVYDGRNDCNALIETATNTLVMGCNTTVIPGSISSIGRSAFSNCSGLTSVTIPNSVTSIREYAFNGCTSLTSVHINDLAAWCNIAFDNNSNPLSYAHHLFIDDTEVTDLVIPNSVTAIGKNAFYQCSSLTSVTIPESVTSIGASAFDFCTGLTSVHINDLAAWCNIAFSTGYSNPLFYAHHLFIDDTEVTDLVIPSGITSIGICAFVGCSGLTSVTIPDGVTSIGESAFYGCSGLTSVTIPEGVTKIGYASFQDCSGLTSVTIPNSVTLIVDYAFRGCSSLTSVISHIQVPFKIFTSCFSGISSNCVLTIPMGTRDAYIAKNWTTDVFKGGIVEYGFKVIDAAGNTVMSMLDYNDNQNNTVTLLDTYRTLTIPVDVPLKQISYVRNFGNTSWQSLYVPFEIPVTAQLLEEFEFAYINGAKQYDDNDDGVADRLTIESFKVKSGTLKANNPYIIRAKTTGEKTITVNEATLYTTAANSIDCSTTTLLFTFQGSYSKLNYEDMVDCYLLGGGTWNLTDVGNTMKPMRFYLMVTSRGNSQVISSAPSIRLQVDGETTDIEASPISSPVGTDMIFDLQGRPVENPEKGIYIINGKKTVVK